MRWPLRNICQPDISMLECYFFRGVGVARQKPEQTWGLGCLNSCVMWDLSLMFTRLCHGHHVLCHIPINLFDEIWWSNCGNHWFIKMYTFSMFISKWFPSEELTIFIIIIIICFTTFLINIHQINFRNIRVRLDLSVSCAVHLKMFHKLPPHINWSQNNLWLMTLKICVCLLTCIRTWCHTIFILIRQNPCSEHFMISLCEIILRKITYPSRRKNKKTGLQATIF